MIHMDGQEPSGFTRSDYRGMDPPQDEPEDKEETIELESLGDLFNKALEEDNFLFAFVSLCYLNPYVCLNPANWL